MLLKRRHSGTSGGRNVLRLLAPLRRQVDKPNAIRWLLFGSLVGCCAILDAQQPSPAPLRPAAPAMQPGGGLPTSGQRDTRTVAESELSQPVTLFVEPLVQNGSARAMGEPAGRDPAAGDGGFRILLDDLSEPADEPWIRPLQLSEEEQEDEMPDWEARQRETIPSDSDPETAGEKLSPTANITVQIQSDFAWFDQEPANVAAVGGIPDGAFFRRARMGVFGELYETVEYRLEFDFAHEARPRFLDNWIALTDIPIINNAIVGHYFEPFSLERYMPNRFITFMERSLADALVPARNMGMMFYGHTPDDRLTYGLGAFRSNSDDYGDDVSFRAGYAGTGHVTFLPWYEEIDDYTLRLLHLGASASYRTPGDDPVRFAAPPSVRMRQQGVGRVPNFVDTGDILDVSHTWLYGLESAWVHGPFSVQAELIQAEVVRDGASDPSFRGGYVYGSWFLTGESRSYSPTSILGRFREGIFQRTRPRSNVFARGGRGGWTGTGAIEFAVRWSFLDLNAGGIEGGYLEDMTYGINWYLNPYTKMMFNYVRPTLHDPVRGVSTMDSYAMRYQFEF